MILSCLLRHDAIGSFLKGDDSPNIAFQLLLEDSAHAGVSLKDFLKLHIFFHKMDAGSYPTLTHLFAPDKFSYSAHCLSKIDELEAFVNKVEGIGQKLADYTLTDDDADEFDPESGDDEDNRGDREEIERFTVLRLYSLRFRDQINGKRSKATEEFLKAIPANYQFLWYQIPFKFEVEELAKSVEGISPTIHGAHSNVLVGLLKTNGTLYPSGFFKRLDITPLSGELERGTTGINIENISGSCLGYTKLSLRYAESLGKATINADEYLQVYYRRSHRIPCTDEVVQSEHLKYYKYSLITDEKVQTLKKSWFMEDLYTSIVGWTYSIFTVARSIKTLKAFAPEKFLVESEKLRECVEKDTENLAMFKKTAAENPEEGYYRNSAWHFGNYQKGLDECKEALDAEVLPANSLEQKITENPFPILFVSNWAWRCNITRNHEFHYTGPLSIGNGIQRIVVPAIEVDIIQKWLTSYVTSDPVIVQSLEEF